MPSKKEVCWVCKGSKGELVHFYYMGVVDAKECPVCKGAGSFEKVFTLHGDRRDCFWCKGKSYVYAEPKWRNCGECRGRGYTKYLYGQ